MMSSIKFMTAQFEAESISLLLFFFFNIRVECSVIG